MLAADPGSWAKVTGSVTNIDPKARSYQVSTSFKVALQKGESQFGVRRASLNLSLAGLHPVSAISGIYRAEMKTDS